MDDPWYCGAPCCGASNHGDVAVDTVMCCSAQRDGVDAHSHADGRGTSHRRHQTGLASLADRRPRQLVASD